jgi:hypothetical protein
MSQNTPEALNPLGEAMCPSSSALKVGAEGEGDGDLDFLAMMQYLKKLKKF